MSSFKKYEEAIACYDKALKIKPDYASAWFGKGSAFSSLGKYKEALKSFDKTKQTDPTFVSTRHFIATYHFTKERL